MTQERCTVCRLPDGKRAEVEATYEVAIGASDADTAVLDVASRYGISRLALRRHREHGGTPAAPRDEARTIPAPPVASTPAPTRKAPPPLGDGASPGPSSAANDLPDPGGGSVVDRARALLGYLAVPGRTTQELAQAREIRAALTLEARLVGAMTTKAKLHEHPDWSVHLEELVTALARIPGALDAVEVFFARAEARRTAA